MRYNNNLIHFLITLPLWILHLIVGHPEKKCKQFENSNLAKCQCGEYIKLKKSYDSKM